MLRSFVTRSFTTTTKAAFFLTHQRFTCRQFSTHMGSKARIIIQQVEHADLLVDNVDKWEHIDKGIILYVCFLKEAVQDDVGKIVKDILESSIAYNTAVQKLTSPLVAGSDIMIIPQASIAGKLKNKQLQFHTLVGKAEGQVLYDMLVDAIKSKTKELTVEESFINKRAPIVVGGTYSNRQGLKFSSYGPSTNVLDY